MTTREHVRNDLCIVSILTEALLKRLDKESLEEIEAELAMIEATIMYSKQTIATNKYREE